MSHHNYRRLFGLLLGSLTGLIYGLVSQTLNTLIMLGIPLYQPPFGMAGNLALCILIGAVLGLVDAWSEVGARGVIWSSVLSTLLVSVATLLSGGTGANILTMKVTAVIALLLPMIGLLAPIMIVFRWIVSREENAYREKLAGFTLPILHRVGIPLALLILSAWVGTASLLNDTAQAVLPRMQALIQQGQQAAASTTDSSGANAALPAPLQPDNVTQFIQRGQGSYALQWDRDENNRYAIPRPPGPDQSTVIAHFDGGYLLVCVFSGPDFPPECRDFTPPYPF
jgi:hypothetical protein